MDVHSPCFSLSLGVILRFHASALPVLSWSTECERGREEGREEGRGEEVEEQRTEGANPGEFLSDSVAFSLTQEERVCVFSELCEGTSDCTFLLYNRGKKSSFPKKSDN